MSNFRSIIHSQDLGEVVKNISGLSEEDAARIVLPWLNTGLRVVGRDPKARCSFGATLDTYTNMETRETVLSPLPLGKVDDYYYRASQGYLIVLGFAFHEAGHLRFSDETHAAIIAAYRGSEDEALALTLSNILDDERLERNLITEYPGCSPAINASRLYMSGSHERAGKMHPKQARFPYHIVTKDDVLQCITLAIAYEGYAGRLNKYNAAFNIHAYCRKLLKEAKEQEVGGIHINRQSGAYTAGTLTIVESHLKQVETLIRMFKRWGKDLPDHAPKPEPPVNPGGNGKDEEPPRPGGQGGNGAGKGEPEPEVKVHPFKAPVQFVAGPPEPVGPACTECGQPENHPNHGSDTGKGGDQPSTDPKGDGKGEGKQGGSDAKPEQPEDKPGEPKSDGKGKGDEPKTEPKGKGGYQPGPIDPHAPAGRGASEGGDEEQDKQTLDAAAKKANDDLNKVLNDPFTHDHDVMTDGTKTGTIDRTPPQSSSTRYPGNADPYLTDAMREAFLSTRYSRETYITGFTRGRLRSRDACKAPAGIPTLFSQRQDSSITRARLIILLDYSSSMRGLVNRSDTFFRSLADATTNIEAVRVSAWTYQSNALMALWESVEGEHVLAERLSGRTPYGGTGTSVTLPMLVDEVERTALPGERQVILSITDGEPDSEPGVRMAVDEARDEGIEVLGVNIGALNQSVNINRQYGDGGITWKGDWSELGDEVLTLIGESLVGARAF